MKTNELIHKLAQECKVRVVVDPSFNTIYCYSIYHKNNSGEDGWWFKIDSLKDSQANLTINEGMCIKQYYAKALKYIAEYLETPIEDREEEKKYKLKLPKEFADANNNMYLTYSPITDNLFFSNGCDYTIAKTIFTQKEIDSMSQSWVNFFIKEEVI